MRRYYTLITLCLLLSMLFLNGCVKQPLEETKPTDSQPATQNTQLQTEAAGDLEDGELPALTLPQQTEPMIEPTEGTTAPTEGTSPVATTEPTETSEPAEPTQPTETTAPPEPTQPTETTAPPEPTQPTETTAPPEPTQPTEQPRLDEDELPPIPIF